MTREEILTEVRAIFYREFEVENPGLDDNIREQYGLDSLDAIELLIQIEKLLGSELTRDEQKKALDIRTISQICDYIESLAKARSLM
jgi:acyl carrier protein